MKKIDKDKPQFKKGDAVIFRYKNFDYVGKYLELYCHEGTPVWHRV
jgi:hypothetical protein